MLGYSNITSKGQVTIPVKLRKQFNLTPQSKVVMVQEPDGIKLKPASDFFNLRGSVKPLKNVTPKKMRESFIDYLSTRKQS